MTWQPVSSVEPTHLYSYDDLDGCRIYLRISEAGSVTVPITSPKPTPSLPPPLEPLLHTRAMRLCNREPRAIARYMQIHQNLSRGR